MSLRRSLFLIIVLLLGACSMRSAINAMSSAEDRAFAQDFVTKVRRGDVQALRPLFEEGLWAESEPQLEMASRLYPDSPGTTELIGYHVASSTTNGVSTSSKDYTLVTHDDSHWTTTVIETRSDMNGPHRIVAWNINGSGEMPATYRQFQMMESVIPWIQGGLIAALLIAGGLVFWLVRRYRRKRAAAQGVGTP